MQCMARGSHASCLHDLNVQVALQHILMHGNLSMYAYSVVPKVCMTIKPAYIPIAIGSKWLKGLSC